MTAPIDFLAELRWRGMLYEMTDGLEARLARGPIRAYVGFDPSADSLHAGHLIPIFGLLHLQRAGGRPVALVGGGTGMIGDPSGRSSERNLLDPATLDANAAALRGQLERFLDFTPGPAAATMIDNREWLARYGLIDFLRDIGKHFSLGYMLAKDSVQLRQEAGMSFTEFSYMTLQATDYLHLHRDYGVELQMGGSDQWGNITAGLELIRRVEGQGDGDVPKAHALAFPLLTSPSGAKFGKSEAGAVFLAAHRTSPFSFYQYWLNTDDRDVGLYLRFLTLLDRATVESLDAETAAHPEKRMAQRALAEDLTARVHGADEAAIQIQLSEVAFSGKATNDPVLLERLWDNVGRPTVTSHEVDAGALRFAVSSNSYPSNSEARRGIAQGGLTINDHRVGAAADPVPEPIAGEFWLVRTGKQRVRSVRLARD